MTWAGRHERSMKSKTLSSTISAIVGDQRGPCLSVAISGLLDVGLPGLPGEAVIGTDSDRGASFVQGRGGVAV